MFRVCFKLSPTPYFLIWGLRILSSIMTISLETELGMGVVDSNATGA